jgi:hypothetical protein
VEDRGGIEAMKKTIRSANTLYFGDSSFGPVCF